MNLISLNMANYIDLAPYGKFINRNCHILKQLDRNVVRGGDHLLVDFVPFGWRRQLKNFLKVRWRMFKFTHEKRGLWYQIYQIGPRKYVYLTWRSALSKRNQKKIWQEITAFAANRSRDDWMLWSYLPYFTEPLESDFCSRKVFDIVDDWRQHDIHRVHRSFLEHAYKIIKQKVDTVFSVSEAALETVGDHPNAHWIPNGVELSRFIDTHPAPVGIKPRIGFVGIIENRLDSKLIERLAREHSEWQFVFAGKVFPHFEGKYLDDLPNVTFLGQISYQEVPKFLASLHVGIVPHKINAFTRSMNPLKIYEYLAAGLPCVTTPVAGSDIFADNVFVAEGNKQFEAAILKALRQSSEADVSRRKESVKQFTWEKRFAEMQKWIFR